MKRISAPAGRWPTVPRALRVALLLVVLAAMAVQQLVAQTHWHAVPHSRPAMVAPQGDSGTGTDNGCLLCQIAAHAASAAPPTALALFLVVRTHVDSAVSYHETDVPAVPAHAWQSRGPPAT